MDTEDTWQEDTLVEKLDNERSCHKELADCRGRCTAAVRPLFEERPEMCRLPLIPPTETMYLAR